MKTVEVILSNSREFDHRNKLNRLDKPVSQSILDKIEAGVTLEDLLEFEKTGLPIFKYQTQITIHGLFPDLGTNYIFGYKNIFQNQNKSIGVKWNAIDEEKRIRISERLRYLGFHYSRNSQGTEFSIQEMLTRENFADVKQRFVDLNNKIDQSLFYGGVYIFIGELFGSKYLCMNLNINAIFEANIDQFLNKIGATLELKEQKDREEFERIEAYELKNKLERAETQKKKELILISMESEISKLSKFERVEKTNLPGVYVSKVFNYKDELDFVVTYIYTPSRAKKPRFNRTSYQTVTEALTHEPKEGWNDNIFNGRVTGAKIA